MHSGQERVCIDEATGAKLPACMQASILKGPGDLSVVANEQVCMRCPAPMPAFFPHRITWPPEIRFSILPSPSIYPRRRIPDRHHAG